MLNLAVGLRKDAVPGLRSSLTVLPGGPHRAGGRPKLLLIHSGSVVRSSSSTTWESHDTEPRCGTCSMHNSVTSASFQWLCPKLLHRRNQMLVGWVEGICIEAHSVGGRQTQPPPDHRPTAGAVGAPKAQRVLAVAVGHKIPAFYGHSSNQPPTC